MEKTKKLSKQHSNAYAVRNSITAELKRINQQIDSAEMNLAAMHDAALEKQEQLERVDTAIKRQENDELVVSDHAIVRYMQRVLGVDIDAIREILLSDHVRQLHLTLGDGTYPLNLPDHPKAFVIIDSCVAVTTLGEK